MYGISDILAGQIVENLVHESNPKAYDYAAIGFILGHEV